jgi:predicted transcriptional regulator
MQIDKQALAFTFLQYSHTKPIRDKYRINGPALTLLCTLYYSEHFLNPLKRGGIKTRLYKLNPQMNYYKFTEWLNDLERSGLIAYSSGNKLQNYTMKTTKEGRQVINELYSVSTIGELVNID